MVSSVPLEPVISTAQASAAHGQVFEDLDLDVAVGSAITITHHNCVVRRCRIRFSDLAGVRIQAGATNTTVEACEIVNTAAPPAGPNPTSSLICIHGQDARGITVSNVILRRGSSGLYMNYCSDVQASGIEGYDFRGPFPRGQLAQYSHCRGRNILEDFSCINTAQSWPEDLVSMYDTPRAVIRRGYLDGCNAPTGVAIMLENGSHGCSVMEVDALRQGNGNFSQYNSNDGTWVECRIMHQVARDQGRGKPSSRAWNSTNRRNFAPTSVYINSGSTRGVQFVVCQHWDVPGQASYRGPPTETGEDWRSNFSGGSAGRAVLYQWTEAPFTPRAPWTNAFPWNR